jgi:ppGpp synthetase/RelA/SpoT-type nucleotidyltranferase
MSTKPKLNKADRKTIELLVQHFAENRSVFGGVLRQLIPALKGDRALSKVIHSLKWRVKDVDHLRDKLERKMLEAKSKGKKFTITKRNLYKKVNDLAGCRILHLHTKQFQEIHDCLKRIFAEYKYELIQGPIAKTWDDESREYFSQIGTKTEKSPSLYTSVHYVIAPNRTTGLTCEIQVRSLAEELWGEVDHTINYPHKSTSLACREQIKVLARVTSSCTRLVDAIFSSHEDHKKQTPQIATDAAPRRASEH